MQIPIPVLFMRGGSSRGAFFLESDLPIAPAQRDRILLAVMGSPDPRQIDGLGGAHPLTSKVGIVRKSAVPGVDVDFLFAQLQPNSDSVGTASSCVNMLAAVAPFALERGIVRPQGETTTLRVLTLNTNMQCDIRVCTPRGIVAYDGDARIDGVPGTSAPITIEFLDTEGSVCPALLPTGRVLDRMDGVDVTCIDNGLPLVVLRADAVGRTGYETVAEMNADADLKARLERLRIVCGQAMGLGDVANKNLPKMTLIAAPRQGGSVSTRYFIPHRFHDAIAVPAAVGVATACVLPGSVADGIATVGSRLVTTVMVEHPHGEFSVEIERDPSDPARVARAALLRTARLVMRGEVMVPAGLWPTAR